jgi:hypothetical protein
MRVGAVESIHMCTLKAMHISRVVYSVISTIQSLDYILLLRSSSSCNKSIYHRYYKAYSSDAWLLNKSNKLCSDGYLQDRYLQDRYLQDHEDRA